jgi:tetratricopeptide (TPR) repeat protein
MVLRFKVPISQILLLAVAFLVCWAAGTSVALGQKLPKATGREPENKPAFRRESRPKRPTPPSASRSAATVESGSFFNLGESFREQKKWKAAEAAYKEAVKVWPGNVEALLELGYLYLDRNRLDEAQQTYSTLRSVNASYASNLLAEINKYKAKLAH